MGDDETRPGPGYELFWQLWISHQGFLLRLGLRWMRGNRTEAEDALSRTKVRAALYFGTHAPELGNVRAWLSRILYNTCMDVYRHPAWEEIEVEVLAEMAHSGTTPLQLSPEEELLEQEILLEVGRGIARLPLSWRDALVKHCLQNRSYEEIATEAETTEANIRKRVQLARRVLRKNLWAPRGIAAGREQLR